MMVLKVVATSDSYGVELMIIRLRLDQTIERVNYLPVTHHDHSDGADT